MRDTTIARNYAEALLELARRADDVAGYGKRIGDLGAAVREDDTLRRFLESPRVSAEQKDEVLSRALGDRVPATYLKFLRALLRNRRQMLIPVIADEYRALLDEAENRLHATVTLAQEPDRAMRDAIARELSRVFGRTVVPSVTVNPAIVGGMVARIGDSVIDGSVRKRLQQLRAKLLAV